MRNTVIGLAAMLSGSITAQTLQEIVKKTDNENFEAAAADFRALLAKDPAKGEHYFYYGENYFKSSEIDSANMLYVKGTEVNATQPLNYVGIGKVLLTKNKVDDAKAQFYKATSLAAGKSAEVLRRVAEAWLVTENKSPDDAITLLNQAIKIEPKNPENYILLGDAQLEKNPTDGSTPVKSYQMATTLNAKSSKGLLRIGKLYQRGKNYQLALDYYKQALAIDPNFAPAYREIAEVYSLYRQPVKAIENWKRYLELNNSDYARYRFMGDLFNNKQYAEAIAEYENLKKTDYKNPFVDRIAAYSFEEMGDKTDKAAYKNGLDAINRFFEQVGPTYNFRASDYKYRGILRIRNGEDSLGTLDVQKSVEMDPASASETYSKLAKIAMDSKDYPKVVKLLEQRRKGDFKNLAVTEAYDLGRAYYQIAQSKQAAVNTLKDELTKKKKPAESPEITLKKNSADSSMRQADSAFIRVLQVSPGYVLGQVYRGRINSFLDPELKSDSAKVFYEKVLQMVKPEERATTYRNYVMESLEFLGYYYVRKKNDEKAKEIFSQLKEIDPNNEKQKAYFNPPKQAPRPAGKPK